MQSSISKFVLLSFFTYTYFKSKICIKYSKLERSSFSSTIDGSCLAYLELKKYILQPKLSFLPTFILLFSTNATECRNTTFFTCLANDNTKEKDILENRILYRDAAGFSNLGGLAVMWWAQSAPLVVIGLTELPNSGWAKAHSAQPLAASLL